jgi:hypothetical protein
MRSQIARTTRAVKDAVAGPILDRRTATWATIAAMLGGMRIQVRKIHD